MTGISLTDPERLRLLEQLLKQENHNGMGNSTSQRHRQCPSEVRDQKKTLIILVADKGELSLYGCYQGNV